MTSFAGFARVDGPFEDRLLGRLVELIRGGADPEFAFLRRTEVPWAEPRAPLAALRVALVTTAGLHRRGDEPFRALEEPLGDPSFRRIAHLTPREELALDAGYVDPKYTALDPEVALPMRALATLVERGVVGSVAAHHYSLVGGVIRPLPGLVESAEVVARALREERVDAVVVAPNCSICVQSAALFASELEARGFATVALTLIPELTRIVGAPRSFGVHFPFGAPFGAPDDAEFQAAVLGEALELLATAHAPRTHVDSRHAWRKPTS
ncbi:MAG: glycine/betaine/sarcosine/D-proline family reductase selenoprotein B [Planctomycetes bacterium]|nr:glycine/betaine/sarcosine/D-proline family reductase selenoprotein B [Planctomycetota bacterium]